MKSLLFFFFVLLLGLPTSCIKHKQIKVVDCHYITNISGKRVVHEVVCNPQRVPEGTLRFFSSGETNQTELEWVVSVVFPNYRQRYIYYKHTYIYCIDDTTSVRWKNLCDVDPSFKNGNKDFSIVGQEHEETDDESIRPVEYYLTIKDSLLLTMPKDYDMLDKFKEYYANE
jgi:hypothetical protein